ncbi:MAG: penicillin acylase family protein [Pirellulales bacterium]
MSVVFGFAYAQAEDYFWQIEDTYLQCVGRYAEVVGERGLPSDLINRSFEVPQRCQQDFAELDEDLKATCRVCRGRELLPRAPSRNQAAAARAL